MIALGSPASVILPPSSHMRRVHRLRRAVMLWLTKIIVRPVEMSSILLMHFLLKGSVADGKNLIDEKNFGLEMRRHRKRQTRLHSAAVMLQRRIKKALHFREGHDFVELPRDLCLAHPQDRAAHEHVFASAEFEMKTSAYLEQATHAAVNLR